MTPWLQSKKGEDCLLSISQYIFNKRHVIRFEKLITYTQGNNNYLFESKFTEKTFTKQNTTIQFRAHDLHHTSHFPLQYQNIFRTKMKKMESPQLAHFEKFTIHLSFISVFLINKHKSLQTRPERPMDNTGPH